MKVLLTGGTGFIGRPLARDLLARGWQVTALVRSPDSPAAHALAHAGARLAIGDVTVRASLREPMAGADIVIHNAGHYELGVDAAGRRQMRAVNVEGTANTLGLARELGVSRTLYVSSTVAFGDSGGEPRDEQYQRSAGYASYYEQTKTEAHAAALAERRRGLPLIIVMPNGVVGPNDHSVFGYYVRLYVNRLLPPAGWGGRSRFSLVYLDDLARGIGLAAERGRLGEDYFLCGEALRISEHFACWRERPGGLRVAAWLPAAPVALALWPLEPLQRAAGLPAVFSREAVRSGVINLNYSSEKARRELGWSFRDARQMWLDTIDGELALLARRRPSGLLARLRPLPEGAA